MRTNSCTWFLRLAIAVLAAQVGFAQEDVADVKSQDLRAGGDPQKRFLLIEPRAGVSAPEKGFGLILVLPGGDGSAEFHPFVKRVYKHGIPDEFIVAQPVAPKWAAAQQITWPTARSKVPGMKFSTEEFVSAVIDEAGTKQKIDPERVFTLSWSSGGPAGYAAALSDSSKVRGSFVAMSVFRPADYPAIASAKDRPFFIYHSPEDRVCPFRMAEQASKALEKSGAKVKLTTYDGGHGWRGPLYDDLRAGLQWLDENRAK